MTGFARESVVFLRSSVVVLLALAFGLAATAPSSANAKYAAIVMDANTGKVMLE